MTITDVLVGLKIDRSMSPVAAVRRVGEIIERSNDKLYTANKIIASLGAPVVTTERTAAVLAKGLVEQALIHGESYKSELAMTIVAGKYMKLVDGMPGVYNAGDPWKDQRSSATTGRAVTSDDKKIRAMQIFERNKTLNNSCIAKLIAKELDITFANAYYYCTRVFKK